MPNTINFEDDIELLLSYLQEVPVEKYLDFSQPKNNQQRTEAEIKADKETLDLGLRRILVPAILTTRVDPLDEEKSKNNDMPASHILASIDDTQDLLPKATFAHMLELNAPSVIVSGAISGGKRAQAAIDVTDAYEISDNNLAPNIKALKELHGNLSTAQSAAVMLKQLEEENDATRDPSIFSGVIIQELYKAHNNIQILLTNISSQQAKHIPNQPNNSLILQHLDNNIGRKIALMHEKHQQFLQNNPTEQLLGFDNIKENIHNEFLQNYSTFTNNLQTLRLNTKNLLADLFKEIDNVYKQKHDSIAKLKSDIQDLEETLKKDFELIKNSNPEVVSINKKIENLKQEVDYITQERQQSTAGTRQTNFEDKSFKEQIYLGVKASGDLELSLRKTEEQRVLVQQKNKIINDLRNDFRVTRKKDYDEVANKVQMLNLQRKPISSDNPDYQRLVTLENLVGAVQEIQLKLFEFNDPFKMVNSENKIIIKDKINELVAYIEVIKSKQPLLLTRDDSKLLDNVMKYLTQTQNVIVNLARNNQEKYLISEDDLEYSNLKLLIRKFNNDELSAKQFYFKLRELEQNHKKTKPSLISQATFKYTSNNNEFAKYKRILDEIHKVKNDFISSYTKVKSQSSNQDPEAKNANEDPSKIFKSKIHKHLDSVQGIMDQLKQEENKLKKPPALSDKKKEIEEAHSYYQTKYKKNTQSSNASGGLKEPLKDDKLLKTMAHAALESGFIAEDAKGLTKDVTSSISPKPK